MPNKGLTPDWVATDPPQGEVLDAFLRELQGSWVWLYREQGSMMGHSIGQYSALLTPERVRGGVSDPGWEVHIGGGGYGFTEYYDPSGRQTIYGFRAASCCGDADVGCAARVRRAESRRTLTDLLGKSPAAPWPRRLPALCGGGVALQTPPPFLSL